MHEIQFQLFIILIFEIVLIAGIQQGVVRRLPPSQTSNKNDRELDIRKSDPYLSEVELKNFVSKNQLQKIQYAEVKNDENFDSDPREKSNRIEDFARMIPKINLHFDPVINFKLKQKITKLGASITLGMDYLSDLCQWRARCDVEDTIVKGRFSLRGSELGWAKSWLWNLGLGAENSAKFKLRIGLNLKTYKAYVRLRFRTEPVSPFDLGDGLTCAGKVGIPGLLHVLGSKPLRLEYLLRIRTPQPDISLSRGDRDGLVSLRTGIDKIDLSLDELNFCLEWDETSPLWDIGLVRDMNRLRHRPTNLNPFRSHSNPNPIRRPSPGKPSVSPSTVKTVLPNLRSPRSFEYRPSSISPNPSSGKI